MNKTLVQEYVYNQIGSKYYVNSLNKESEDEYSLTLGLQYPIWINDIKNNSVNIKFINFSNLYSTKLIFKEGKVSTPNLDRVSLANSVFQKNNDLIHKTEDSIFDLAFFKFIKIPLVLTFLRPINRILDSVIINGKITTEEIEGEKKFKKYVNFLNDLDILQETTEGYIEGNIPKIIRKKHSESLEKDDLKIKNELIEEIFGLAIKEGIHYITNELKIKILVPFIKSSSTYYSQAFKADDNILMSKEELYNKYKLIYSKRLKFNKFDSYLNDLQRVQILTDTDGYITGDKKIFESIKTELTAFYPIHT